MGGTGGNKKKEGKTRSKGDEMPGGWNKKGQIPLILEHENMIFREKKQEYLNMCIHVQ